MSGEERYEQPRKQQEGLGSLAITEMKTIIIPPVQEYAWGPLDNLNICKDLEKQYLNKYMHTEVILYLARITAWKSCHGQALNSKGNTHAENKPLLCLWVS